ncbi:hypothetical protein D3C75_348060 [compost metagenome]
MRKNRIGVLDPFPKKGLNALLGRNPRNEPRVVQSTTRHRVMLRLYRRMASLDFSGR